MTPNALLFTLIFAPLTFTATDSKLRRRSNSSVPDLTIPTTIPSNIYECVGKTVALSSGSLKASRPTGAMSFILPEPTNQTPDAKNDWLTDEHWSSSNVALASCPHCIAAVQLNVTPGNKGVVYANDNEETSAPLSGVGKRMIKTWIAVAAIITVLSQLDSILIVTPTHGMGYGECGWAALTI